MSLLSNLMMQFVGIGGAELIIIVYNNCSPHIWIKEDARAC